MERWLALLTTGSFIVLCSYAYGTSQRHIIPTWPNDKARTIAGIFDISPDEVEKPIHIFGK